MRVIARHLVPFVLLAGALPACEDPPHGTPEGPVRPVTPTFGVAQWGVVGHDGVVDLDRLATLEADEMWGKVAWNWIETAPGSFEWETLDGIVDTVTGARCELSLKLRTGQEHWGVTSPTTTRPTELPELPARTRQGRGTFRQQRAASVESPVSRAREAQRTPGSPSCMHRRTDTALVEDWRYAQ